MTTKQNLYSTAILLVFAILFWASAVQKISTVEKTYYETKKEDKNITVSYRLPVIKPTGKTTQMQTKGGVIITTEIIPFTANRTVNQTKNIAYADATKPGYDIWEVTNTPGYTVSPDNINFKIRIRNNEQVPLKLSEVGFAIIIDGVQWSFPTGYLDDWNKGLILTGFEKEYTIKGPQLDGLYTAQVVYLFLNGVPTSYNEAGSVTKKSNFEWYFECKTETVQKEEKETYTYETSLIETRKCAKCSGTGTDPQPYKCSTCDGKGSYVSSYDGKTYKCSKCSGSGRVYYKCDNCSGKGITYHPKSQEAPIKSSVTWNGWQVDVKSIPSGATIKGMDTKTGEYTTYRCTTPCKINWYCTSGKSCPIIVEYNGQSVKVLPYKPDGKESGKIEVDFTSGTPFVKKGRQAN